MRPKRGRAVLWYNVRLDTLEQHMEALHEAMPIVGGTKWACNKWIHFYNFYDNWLKGLTG